MLQHGQSIGLASSIRPLFACFSVVGPRKTKTYNLENELKPFTLNNLWNVPGARKRKRILGRGPGCKHGKLSGRGMKGQGQRGSKKHPKFEGNNKELYLRIPKFGLKKSIHRFDTVNLGQILYSIEKGWSNPNEVITIRALKEVGLIKSPKFGVKLLSRSSDKLNLPLKFEVSAATEVVINAVKAAGGEITIKYRTPLKLREHLYPHKFPVPLGEPVAPQSEVRRMEKYRSKGRIRLNRRSQSRIQYARMGCQARRREQVYRTREQGVAERAWY